MTKHGASKDLGQKFRSERVRRGWTQQTLAGVADVSIASVQRAERGELTDGLALAKLAAVLSTPGPTLSEPASTRVQPSASVPSPLAQMVGSLQAPNADLYIQLVELALERKDSPEVFAKLAAARAKAPPGADFGYWMRAYMAAVDESRREGGSPDDTSGRPSS